MRWLPILRRAVALIMKFNILLLPLLLFFASCRRQETVAADNGAFAVAEKGDNRVGYDLEEMRNGGELIVATLSGPDTYFIYQGQPMGVQYALAADFATKEGLRLRVETANDTVALIHLLQNGDADILALELPSDMIVKHALVAAGVTSADGSKSWAIRDKAPVLAEALRSWQTADPEPQIRQKEEVRFAERRQVRRKARAVYLSRERGVISVYDDYFREAAVTTGWDWRLIAAQCYQESAFDPSALSWAGACGLMQLMPATARGLGVSADNIYVPKDNVDAAARYIRQLNNNFSDISSGEERVKFVLAAYNGGAGHIRDAMSLVRKYGGNAHSWNDVSSYVLRLSEPKFYRDDAVKYGYMIGAETVGYVADVLERYRGYGGDISTAGRGSRQGEGGAGGRRTHKKNKYSKEQRIYSAEELKQ